MIRWPQSTSHIHNVCIVWTLTIDSEHKSQQWQSKHIFTNIFFKEKKTEIMCFLYAVLWPQISPQLCTPLAIKQQRNINSSQRHWCCNKASTFPCSLHTFLCKLKKHRLKLCRHFRETCLRKWDVKILVKVGEYRYTLV